ncbi:MAG: hypothetical protein V2I32_09765, partial [Desulforhopalus sp.]|nr:hypothetical protein [Desulforhopalus sp.]
MLNLGAKRYLLNQRKYLKNFAEWHADLSTTQRHLEKVNHTLVQTICQIFTRATHSGRLFLGL